MSADQERRELLEDGIEYHKGSANYLKKDILLNLRIAAAGGVVAGAGGVGILDALFESKSGLEVAVSLPAMVLGALMVKNSLTDSKISSEALEEEIERVTIFDVELTKLTGSEATAAAEPLA